MPARVPYVDRPDLDAEGQQIYDTIRRDRNATTVGLQFRALLNSPKAAGYLTSMGAELRFRSAIPENLKEFVIAVVSREWNSDIEWTAHAALAAKASDSWMPESAAALKALHARLNAAPRRRDFKTAAAQCAAALALDPMDGPSRVYLERAKEYLLAPPPTDWDGVYELKSK